MTVLEAECSLLPHIEDHYEIILLSPYSDFTPGTPVLTTVPQPGGGIPPMIGECVKQEIWIKRVDEMDIKKTLK